jgi:DNA primase
MDTVSEIKSRLSIVDVVSHYLQLKKVGRNFKGLCPFHNDTHPSFLVSPEKEIAWCFVCNNGGDIFSFVQKIEGVDFQESVRILADMAGVSVVLKGEKEQGKKEYKEQLFVLLEEAQKFFTEQFLNTEKARKYIFETRGFPKEIAEKFGIGYAPEEFHALEQYLLKKGFSRKDMLNAGVATTKDERAEAVYDKFRARITFPIKDLHGKIRGFGSRILDEGEPKYLNSPETALYEKSKLLFGLHEAKQAIREHGTVFIVEGNLDVMACHLAGIENVVASSGTAISKEQVVLLKRFAKKGLLLFDADTAGREATKRAIQICLQEDFAVEVVLLSNAKDPDEAIKNHPEDFFLQIQEPKNAMEVLILWETENRDITKAEEKKMILEGLFPFISSIESAIEQKEVLQKVALSIRVEKMALEKDFFEFAKKKRLFKKEEKQPLKNQAQKISKREYFFGFFLAFPEFFGVAKERIDADFFSGEEKDLYSRILESYNRNGVFSPSEVLQFFPDQERESIARISLSIEERNAHADDFSKQKQAERIVEEFGADLLDRLIKSSLNEEDRRIAFFKRTSFYAQFSR